MKGTIKRLWHKLTHLCVTWHRASAAPPCGKDKTKWGWWGKEPTKFSSNAGSGSRSSVKCGFIQKITSVLYENKKQATK